MHFLRYIIRLIGYYGKHKLPFLYYSDGEDAHEHICLAARLLGEDLSYICPLSQLKGFEPEYDLACDHCKYFGVVRFSGNNMKIVLNEKIAEISKE